jgi:aryl-alcohol dehydrogenase-like predicted oxidoreductase
MGMETRSVGQLKVSVVGLGTNNFGMRMDAKASAAVVYACLDAGINHFDSADVYGGGKSEEYLGQALGKRRDEAVIATKFGASTGGSAGAARQAVDDGLARLGTDRIDLMYLHRPDPNTPIAETLGALDECVKAGKVREVACSNFDAEMLRSASAVVAAGHARFVAVQNHFNLLSRGEEALLPVLGELGIAHIPYYPLASGLLSGKYRKGEAPPEGTRLASFPEDRRTTLLNDGNFYVVDSLSAWAADHGHSVLELAIAWLAAKPTVASVIAGATKVEQVEANAKAGSWVLSADEVAEVDTIAAR